MSCNLWNHKTVFFISPLCGVTDILIFQSPKLSLSSASSPSYGFSLSQGLPQRHCRQQSCKKKKNKINKNTAASHASQTLAFTYPRLQMLLFLLSAPRPFPLCHR